MFSADREIFSADLHGREEKECGERFMILSIEPD